MKEAAEGQVTPAVCDRNLGSLITAFTFRLMSIKSTLRLCKNAHVRRAKTTVKLQRLKG